MTLQAVAGFLGQSGLQHPAQLYRNLVAGIAGRRSGMFRYNDFALTPSGSDMSLTIGSGEAVVMGTEAVTTQGGYYVWNNAPEVLPFPASTTLPRVDSLILRVIDTDYGADPAGSKATWEVVSGTPAASPVAVSSAQLNAGGTYYHPGAWLRIADFVVPASAGNLAAATLQHLRTYARVGRHTIVRSTAFPTDPQLGDTATQTDGLAAGVLHHYNGTSWVNAGAGVWGDYTPTFYSNLSTGATTTLPNITYSRLMNQGNTTYLMGSCSIPSGLTSTSGFGFSLPYPASRRFVNLGSLVFTSTGGAGSGFPTDVTGAAAAHNSGTFQRVGALLYGGGYANITSGGGLNMHWNISYERA